MKYSAADKLEIIRLVAGSHIGVKRTLARIGVPRTTFYRWYDLYAGSAKPVSTIGAPVLAASGTVFRTIFAATSSIWHWNGRSFPRASFR